MCIFQFVDSISTTPTVLLDLDASPLAVVESTSNTPPPVRYGVLDRALVDGSNITSDLWADRTIELHLDIEEVSAEEQAETIQKLARIVARGGCWLKWQPDGLTQPVFFLTKKPDFRVIEDILDATPRRELHLTLPAEPFAFGLPETGALAIVNHPTTAGVGMWPMLATLPEIKGDVPAPLGLSFETPEADHNIFWQSQAILSGSAQAACYWKSFSAETINGTPGTGWTITDTTQTGSISTNVRRVARSSGATKVLPADGLLQAWDDLPPGDYRVFIRVYGADSGARLKLYTRVPDDITGELSDPVANVQLDGTVDTAVWDWIDMGVIAMPYSGPVADDTFGLAPSPQPAPWTLEITMTGSQSIDLDGILLVPAGGPDVTTRQGYIGFSPFYDNKVVTIEPLSDQWYAYGESVYTSGVTSPVPVVNIGGSAPVVVPGAVANQLHFLATTSINAESRRNNEGDEVYYDRISDDKTLTTTVNWHYYPRYLQVRPELT